MTHFFSEAEVKMQCDKCGGAKGTATMQGIVYSSMPPKTPWNWVCDACGAKTVFTIGPRMDDYVRKPTFQTR